MKKMLKSYFAFASLPYRIMWMVIVPAVWLGLLFAAGQSGKEHITCLTFPLVIESYIVGLGVFSDYFFMGGICAGGGNTVRCLNTSVKGQWLFCNVLCADLGRHFLYCMVYGGVRVVLSGELFGLVEGLLMYLITAAVLNGARYISAFQMQMLIALLAGVGYMLCSMLGRVFISGIGGNGILAAVIILLSAACAAVSILSVKHMLWRINAGERSK